MQSDAESATEKWGLEAGLFKVFTNKDDKSGKSKGQQTKELLARYGSAYLLTSISFSLVSFSLCYALVTSGNIDMIIYYLFAKLSQGNVDLQQG